MLELAGRDLVWVLDISLSMGRSYGEFKPSKLESCKEAIAYASSRLLSSPGNRVGLVVFHGRAAPLLPPTHSVDALIATLARVVYVAEGSAGGDGVVEAVKMLRRSGRARQAVMVTDAGFNAGVPLPLAALYASNMGVRLDIVTVGARPGEAASKALSAAAGEAGGSWVHAETPEQLFKALAEVALAAGRL